MAMTKGQSELLKTILDDQGLEVTRGTYNGRSGVSSDCALVVGEHWSDILAAVLNWMVEDAAGVESVVDAIDANHDEEETVFDPWSIRWDNMGNALILY